MNKSVFYPLLVVLLLMAFSCKSEGNRSTTSAEEVNSRNENAEQLDSEIQNEDVTSTPIVVEKKKEEPKEVIKPPKEEKKKTKRKVDKGIEIEMGYDLEQEEEKEEEKQEEKVETQNELQEEDEVKQTDNEKVDKPDKPEVIDRFVGFPSHSVLDALLKKYVSASGVVNYKGLKSEESTLDKYITILETNPPGTTWNRDQKMAYWINAYNAFTIKLILKNYPVKSIMNLDSGKTWDVKWINLDGKSLSLNDIEHKIIRPTFNDPRIHFAVNCAAKSCPPILNGAYMAKTLEAQLESQTKKFINNASYNSLDKNKIVVSKIFEWYAQDFGDIATYVRRYAETTIKPSAKVEYQEYNWELNGK